MCVTDSSESLAAQSADAGDTAAADAAAASSMHPDGGDGMSASQRELVDIMQQVKTKQVTQQQAEVFFYDWKTRHERGCSRSFKQKQVGGLAISFFIYFSSRS